MLADGMLTALSVGLLTNRLRRTLSITDPLLRHPIIDAVPDRGGMTALNKIG
jgi:hypothetical protein